MNKTDFILGKNIITNIYNYDDQGNMYNKKVKGKVIQITKNFVVIDNGVYKEAFKYSQFQPEQYFNQNDVSYDLSIENYFEDIVNNCIKSVENNETGYVFNKKQLNEVLGRLNIKEINIKKENNIIYLSKK